MLEVRRANEYGVLAFDVGDDRPADMHRLALSRRRLRPCGLWALALIEILDGNKAGRAHCCGRHAGLSSGW